MATSAVAPQIDPSTGERIDTPSIDPATGERMQPRSASRPAGPAPLDPSQMTSDVAGDAFTAAVHSKMLGITPGYAYQNRTEIDKQMRERGGDDFDKGFGYAAKTGFEDTPLGLILRGQAPEPFESHS